MVHLLMGIGRKEDGRKEYRGKDVTTPAFTHLLFGRVALGGYPPRAPTDPYVDTLDHTVPQVTPSLCRDLASVVADPLSAIHWRCGDTR